MTPYGNGLAALWRVPFDHLTRYAIHDFRSFSRLCGGPYRPLSFDKLVRPYQPPALYANLKDARGAIAPTIFLQLLSASNLSGRSGEGPCCRYSVPRCASSGPQLTFFRPRLKSRHEAETTRGHRIGFPSYQGPNIFLSCPASGIAAIELFVVPKPPLVTLPIETVEVDFAVGAWGTYQFLRCG